MFTPSTIALFSHGHNTLPSAPWSPAITLTMSPVFIFSFIILNRIKALQGANDTIFMNVFTKFSCYRSKTRVPLISPAAFNNTHALSSNLMYDPSALLTSFLVRTTTAVETAPF
jgi:hypothetical protein